MNYAIIDSRTPIEIKNSLIAEDFGIISMPEWDRLQKPVSAHPDMLMFIADGRVFTHKDYYSVAEDEFSIIADKGYSLFFSDEEISSDYPNDIRFNCVEFQNIIYGKKSHASTLITGYASNEGKLFCNVRQGYAKCSVCKVSDSSAITADPSMYKALVKNGIDTLMISADGVALDGYDRGFIGGCSGVFKDRIYFSGNILLHPDGEKIRDFCEKHGKQPISLSSSPLFDGGSIYFI